jgi:hypothetical protein
VGPAPVRKGPAPAGGSIAAVPPALRALRGATTVDADTKEQVDERVRHPPQQMLERNDVDHDDLVSILFTATDDIHASSRRPRPGRSGSATSR